jgi:hypothetical protein
MMAKKERTDVDRLFIYLYSCLLFSSPLLSTPNLINDKKSRGKKHTPGLQEYVGVQEYEGVPRSTTEYASKILCTAVSFL